MSRSFFQVSNNRKLPPDYSGDVLLWDIDKTYLQTNFSSLSGLLPILIEAAIDKHAVPGAVPLLRALRRGPEKRSAIVPLYFVSGSPVQLRGVIERKMLLDGVDFDGIAFKDQLHLLLSGKPRAVIEQVGYKLCALLTYRRALPKRAHWLLFGDDVESDATVFELFGEVCAGLRGERLWARLRKMRVARFARDAAVQLADGLPLGLNPVERIFIHLTRGRPPAAFASERVVPSRSFLQAALVLLMMGKIAPGAIGTVADDLRRHRVGEAEIEAQLADAQTRLAVPDDIVALARP